jgi:uncharacterized membrane protein
MFVLAAAVASVAVGAFLLFGGFSGGSIVVSASEDGLIRIPLSDVSDGSAHFFTYRSSAGNPVRFFVLRSSDGVIRAAFDTCDVCYPAKKGYRQEGDQMVCNNCGLKFPSTGINEVKGGCNPMPLNRVDDGQDVVIEASEVEAGRMYF